jgi:uncharacterized protein YprB with RNaseH-like and TPR domain
VECEEVKKPKILFFDIESGGVNALKSDLGFVLMFGYKWAHEKKAKVLTIRKKELRHFNDGPLLTRLSELMTEADLIVAHYGSIFDRRFIQGRLMIHGLPAIPATKMRDTCMIARSAANYSSNRLKYLAKILNLKNQKLENNWPTAWFQVMQGNMKALKGMADYCKGDVLALEELYYKLLPFDRAHPRMYPVGECRVCGSTNTQHRGWHVTKEHKYARFQCQECGTWDHERKAVA